jgi:membrane protease YdiL (CAAX protease family)
MTTQSTKPQLKSASLLVFFLLAFGISWIVWIPLTMASHGLIAFQIPIGIVGLLGAFGPSLAAIIITRAREGKAELHNLLRRLLLWRVDVRWYLFVLLWPPILSLATTGGHILLGGLSPDFNDPLVLSAYPLPPEAKAFGPWPLLPFVFLHQMLMSSPMGEEIGWRGFALPRLQRGRNALISSVILGLLWFVWHLPLYLNREHPLFNQFLGWLVLSFVADAILFTWVYNNTEGSLLLPLLLHTSMNITGLFLPPAASPLLELALRWGVVAIVIIYAGPSHLSRRSVSESGAG